MQATRPTMRPAERSVPVRIIAPAIPSAIGRLAAESEMILTMEEGERKRGLRHSIKMMAATRKI